MAHEVILCPECRTKGRKVLRSALMSLLKGSARARLSDGSTFLFCRTPSCSTVYFSSVLSDSYRTEDLRVTVFQKSLEPHRLVCYCFKHSVQSIHDELIETGDSRVAETIGAKCKQGLDRCESENPQGSCCLGNIRQVVVRAKAALGLLKESACEPEPPACCGGGVG
jgi:hypothetical protein